MIVVPIDGGARTFEIPSLRPVARVPEMSEAYHSTNNHRDDQRRKYTLDRFVNFEPDDTLIDVGAYVRCLAMEI